jgi:hypothetical protein
LLGGGGGSENTIGVLLGLSNAIALELAELLQCACKKYVKKRAICQQPFYGSDRAVRTERAPMGGACPEKLSALADRVITDVNY